MKEQEVKNIIGEVLNDLDARVAPFDSMRSLGRALRAEADRLTKPAEDSSPEAQFEGVKYVVFEGTEHRRVATEEEWRRAHPEGESPPPGAIFVQAPQGYFTYDAPWRYAPWHPPVGAQVRLEAHPECVGVAIAAPGDDDSGRQWVAWKAPHRTGSHDISNLRPCQFGPEPKPEDQFEGVKYVVWTGKPHELRLLALLPRHRHIASVCAPGHASAPFRVDVANITPWHPKKGDRVWLQDKPSIRTVRFVSADGVTYNLARHNGASDWGINISDLRPHSFPPEHTKPEAESEGGKAEFEAGELVADADGGLRITEMVGGKNAFRHLEGGPAELRSPYRLATTEDVANYAQEWGGSVRIALRAHAKTIAREAQKENSDG